MIALVRQVIVCVTAASLFGAVALSLTPDSACKEIVRIGVGLVLILSLAVPLRAAISLPSMDFLTDTDVSQQAAADVYQDAVRQQVQVETAQYIEEQARELGVSCTAGVTAEISDDGTVSIAAVHLSTEESAAESELEAVKQQIMTELDVPEQSIVIDEEGAS